MKDFLWDWRYLIIVLVIIIIAMIVNWEHTKEYLLEAMLDAKTLAKDGILKTGKEQEDWVVKLIFKILPAPISLILSESFVRKLIRYFYKKSMDFLDDGKINNSIQDKRNSAKK